MKAPIARLTKQELIKIARWTCKHRHSGLEHYDCYLEENPDTERLGFFDIESSNLKGDFGVMLCYALKDAKTGKIMSDVITRKDLDSEDLDKRVVAQCVKDLENFDKVVTYYGTGFDFPFVRTRAAALGIPFPSYGELLHRDLYYIVRGKFSLHRNRLEVACETLLGQTRKSHFKPKHWIRALQGNAESLKYIQEHCIGDVQDLADLYLKIINCTKGENRSI